VVHRIPSDKALTITISSPPQCRSSALKFFFTVPHIATARLAAQAAGGDVLLEQWQGPGFVVCDAYDPEGNVFHIRESVSQPIIPPNLAHKAAQGR
jgi:predicted enzyme related to lactoylglutathione lyase